MKKAEILIEGGKGRDEHKKIADAIIAILKSLPIIEQETAQKALETFAEVAELKVNISNNTFTTTKEK